MRLVDTLEDITRAGLNKETTGTGVLNGKCVGYFVFKTFKKIKERLENFPVGYRINDFSLVSSIWEGKCPSPDRLPLILQL